MNKLILDNTHFSVCIIAIVEISEYNFHDSMVNIISTIGRYRKWRRITAVILKRLKMSVLQSEINKTIKYQ